MTTKIKPFTFVCNRNDLLRGITLANFVVEQRNFIPILSNVLIRADSRTVTVRSTDLDNTISHTLPRLNGSKTSATGEITLPCNVLLGFLKDADDVETVTISTDAPGSVKVEAGATFDMMDMPASDFPSMAEDEWEGKFSIAASDLMEAFRIVVPAISKEETRYYLNGAFIEPKSKYLTATDGHVLHQAALPIADIDDAPNGIIHRRTIDVVRKWIGKTNTGDVDIKLSQRQIRIALGETVVLAKLIDGRYPDYQRVIPQEIAGTVSLDIERLNKALRRVSRNKDAVKMSLDRDSCTLSQHDHDHGTISDTMQCKFGAEPFQIGLNGNLTKGCLGVFDGGDVQMSYKDAGSPVVWRRSDATHPLCIQMPMKVV